MISTTKFIAALAVSISVGVGTLGVNGPSARTAVQDAARAQEHALHGPTSTHPTRLAITVDDMPRSAKLPDGYTSLRLVSELVAALRAHDVPGATGFVIGERLANDPEGLAALRVWIAAGYELGNHTYWHRPLDQIRADQFLADLAQMDPLADEIARLEGRPVHYFRYPYLEEGSTGEERKLLARALGEHGYTVARVSADFDDWAWADPYARCMQRGDTHALHALSRSYLANGAAYLAWSVAAARKLWQRPFTQVLLLHANVATAQNLDALLTKYERMGVEYISLQDALDDPAYTADCDTPAGNVLTRASLTRRHALPPWLVSPLDLLELACR